MLVMLVGLSLARFQRQRLFAGDTLAVLRPLATHLTHYALLVAGFSLARGEVLWPSVFLVGNLGFAAPPHRMPYLYWFVEAYAQTILLSAAVFSIPSVRRVAAGQRRCGATAWIGPRRVDACRSRQVAHAVRLVYRRPADIHPAGRILSGRARLVTVLPRHATKTQGILCFHRCSLPGAGLVGRQLDRFLGQVHAGARCRLRPAFHSPHDVARLDGAPDPAGLRRQFTSIFFTALSPTGSAWARSPQARQQPS